MAKKEKPSFHFSFSHLTRIGLFLLAFFWLINILSGAKSPRHDPTMFAGETSQTLLNHLGDYLYSLIPVHTKQKISDIPNTAVVKGVNRQVEDIHNRAKNWPQTIIKDIKNQIAKLIYESIIGQE